MMVDQYDGIWRKQLSVWSVWWSVADVIVLKKHLAKPIRKYQSCLLHWNEYASIPDPRFRPEFRQFHRWNNGSVRYKLGWELNMETHTGPSFSARSRLECVTVCQLSNNCTGVEYDPYGHVCRTVTFEYVVLPWRKKIIYHTSIHHKYA